MDMYFQAIGQAINQQNWHAALMMSLAMPDICSKNMYQGGVGERYRAWFNDYLATKYMSPARENMPRAVYMSAQDCYLLRCSFLHSASDVTTPGANIFSVLVKFNFTLPINGGGLHNIRINDQLILRVDIFANDVVDAARVWWSSRTDQQKRDINGRLLQIHNVSSVTVSNSSEISIK